MKYKWLILRRGFQVTVLTAFLLGPWAGIWLVKGNLSSSLTLNTLPLTDPFVLLQTMAAGHWPGSTALLGAVLLGGFYAVIGGRMFCAWVCPVNMVTDAAHWLGERLGLQRGWQPRRQMRLWLLGAVLAVSALSGTAAWEFVNPVSMLHRGLFYGFGLAWGIVLAVFLFDLLISRRGWCGHLCPMGACYGLIGSFSLMRVVASNRQACNDCMDCFKACPEPHVIGPALKKDNSPAILNRDCTNCGACMDVCAKKVFTMGTRFAVREPNLNETRKAA